MRAHWPSPTEIGGGGYARKTIDHTDCTKEYANNPRDIIYQEQTFTFTGPFTGDVSALGWALIDQTGVYIDAYGYFGTAYTPLSGGGTLTFTPRIQEGNVEGAPV
jgi:hypothetical protein